MYVDNILDIVEDSINKVTINFPDSYFSNILEHREYIIQ